MVASEKRLTSMRRLSTRPARKACSWVTSLGRCRLPDHQVDELPGHDDLLDDLLAVDVAPYRRIRPGELHELLARRVRRRLDARAPLAVDLHDEGEDVAGQQLGVRLGPGILPDPAPGDRLIDLAG